MGERKGDTDREQCQTAHHMGTVSPVSLDRNMVRPLLFPGKPTNQLRTSSNRCDGEALRLRDVELSRVPKGIDRWLRSGKSIR